MESDLKIAAIIIYIITNFAAIFFIKSRFSSIVVITLSTFFLIGLISLILTNNILFLKIACALVVFLVVANYSFCDDLSNIDFLIKTRNRKLILLVLPCVFFTLFATILYLGNSMSNVRSEKAKSVFSDTLAKDKSNLLSYRSAKVKKIREMSQKNVIISNISLIILMAIIVPVIYFSQNTKPNNIS